MANFLNNLRRVLEAFAEQYPSLEVTRREQAIALLDAAGETVTPELLGQLETAFTPVFGLGVLEQMHDMFPGSLDSQIDHVRRALRKTKAYGHYPYLMAVYPDFLIVCAYIYDSDDEREKHFKVAYTFDPNTREVTFGEVEEVGIETVFVAPEPEGDDDMVADVSAQATPSAAFDAAAAANGDGANVLDGDTPQATAKATGSDLTQAKMKTEAGQQFSRNAYLIVGNAEQTSTWKVRVEESPGKVTVAQLGRAYAALTKGFRGNKVEASEEQIQAALKKLKSLYRKMDAPWPGSKTKKQDVANYPDWLLQGDDPPGGEEELTFGFRMLFQQEGAVGADGVMHVTGVATVADVLSRNQEVYPLAVWEANIPRLQEMLEAGRLLGEVDHPEDGRSRLKNTALRFTAIQLQGTELHCKAIVLPTFPDGKNLQVMIANGVAVDFSSRGRGRVVQQTWQGIDNVKVIQLGYRCDAFDAVLNGASPGSTVTDWSMAQSADQSQTVDQEEIEMGEVSEKILEAIQGLSSRLDKIEAGNGASAAVAAATAAVPETQTQGAAAAADAAVAAATGGQQLTWTPETATYMTEQAVALRIEQAIKDVTGKWSPRFVEKFREHLQKADPKTLKEANEVIAARLELFQTMVDDAPQFPSQGFIVQKDRGERGPQTPNEVIEALVQHLDDTPRETPMSTFADENGSERPDWVLTPRRQCRRWLRNIALLQTEGFDGRAAIHNLMRLEQGFRPNLHPDAFLNQTCADMTTAVGASGAPTSAIFIYPLVTRVFPRLIANELASIQPLDRPEGKIFYLDFYRHNPSHNETDESGNVSSSRIRMDRSDSFLNTYSDDPGECETAAQIQLHLSSKTVTAVAKKLHAVWSTEEVQDLRAYHGLDAAAELMGALSLQIALEWNGLILADLLSGATAGNSTYGTTAPSGYTAKEWEEYLPRYVEKASNDIFRQRNGEATHVIAGPSAWLRLAAAFRTGTRGAGENPEMFPGLTLTPFVMGAMANFRTYKTNFWSGVNADKILVLRRGANWADTPYVWSPYVTYISPPLTLPDTFTHKQGIMDRAARKVVNGNAIATVTIAAGTGVPVS